MQPMNSPELSKLAFRVRKRYVVLLIILCMPVIDAIGYASYFVHGREHGVLRDGAAGPGFSGGVGARQSAAAAGTRGEGRAMEDRGSEIGKRWAGFELRTWMGAS